MKILFHGYNTYAQNASGGVQVRMRLIAEHLRKVGVIVDFFDHNTMKVTDYDIIHFFRLEPEHFSLANYAYINGVKVVVSSIVTPIDGWKIDLILRLIRHPLMTIYNKNQSLINCASAIITETKQERDFIAKYYRNCKDKLLIIPNGIEEPEKIVSDEIFTLLGKECDYVLCVGRFDENKNQYRVIKALKETETEIVFIGGPTKTEDTYYEKCCQEAKGHSNIHILGWVDNGSSLLKSAYANARCFVLPSFNETFGLVLIEAAVYGANLVVSETLPILDFPVMDCCDRINPSNVDSIRKTVLQSMQKEKNLAQIKAMIEVFSWDKIVDKHIKLYESIL